MKARRWYLVPVLGFVLLTLVGCGAVVVGAAAGAGAIAYIRGELKATEEAPIADVFAAAKAAMADLEFTVLSAEADAFDGKVRAETAAGKEVAVRLERESDTTTTIRIRVDILGDEELSRLIHEKIQANLSASS